MDYLECNMDEMLKVLKESISFNSVLADPIRNKDGNLYPFGAEIQKCYEHMLNVGESLGFKAFNADNYGGHIEYAPADANSKTEILGISAHLDIVPAGDGWVHPPFDGVVEDNYLYGRGTTDDKGPLVACLFAMKAVKDYLEAEGREPNKRIRLILGLDEETGKVGMKYYLDKAEAPTIGFTPDGDFPLINGEKGTMIFDLVRKLNKQASKEGLRLTKLESGLAPNSVPASARAVVASQDASRYDRIKEVAALYTEETGYKLSCKRMGTSLGIESVGVAAHGAMPETGLNALSIMMDFLSRLDFNNDEINDFVAFYNDKIGFDLTGDKIGVRSEDEQSGVTVWNVGMARIDEEAASISVNIRFPVTDNKERVLKILEDSLQGTSIGIVVKRTEDPLFIPQDFDMVKTLVSAYRQETGDMDSEPKVIGAGTYAKCIPNTLCFGALFPGDEDRMHQANERLSLDNFHKYARIYARAIYMLSCE